MIYRLTLESGVGKIGDDYRVSYVANSRKMVRKCL